MWAPSPGLKFFDGIEAALMKRAEEGDVLKATGPEFLTDYGYENDRHAALLPSPRVYPLAHWDHDRKRQLARMPPEAILELFPRAGAITFWCNSWSVQRNSVPPQPSPSAKPEKHNPAKIHVAVLGTPGSRLLRAVARETWTLELPPEITYTFCAEAGEGADDESGNPDDKSVAGLLPTSVLELRHRHPEAGWIFICSEETYLVPERLEELADPDFGLVGSPSLLTKGRPCLRAGFLLSRRAAVILAQRGFSGPLSDILPLFKEAGIRWKATHRLRPDAQLIPDQNNDLASACFSETQRLKAIHTFLYDDPLWTARAAHHDWRDDLEFYEGGYFRKKNHGSFGEWRDEGHGAIYLDWFDWAPEAFIAVSQSPTGFPDAGLVVHELAAGEVLRR
ncbi:hypothetical protein OJ996_04940 [Luteolibacter sp. GHJ8]|uniref:Uncharacterized protein n=2 Tax=Luteolibacter rhizosphaerae TaxID=2989719 RepID=A0ABT3FZ87_9BACT|nr:hypothetical protein [Luteolibacter rhizosphaerae]